MKLKTFQKISTSVETTYYVMKTGSWKSKEFETIDYFTVNYLEKDNEKLQKSILKRMYYENNGANIVNIDVTNNHLGVTIEI